LQSSHEIQTNYSFDPEVGEVRSKLTGWRMLLLSSDAWESLENGIYSKFPTNAALIILQMGFSYGSNIAIKFAPPDSESEKIVLDPAFLAQVVLKAGWGIVSFTGDLDLGAHFSITIKNCVFCNAKNSYPCNFLRGVMLGLATKMYRCEYLSSTSCIGENEKHVCKIELVGK
jgi:hypothetical protein